MNGEIRRAKIENILKSSAVPVPGVTLAKDLDVSRQIIVSDIALLRANGLTILSTNKVILFQNNPPASGYLK